MTFSLDINVQVYKDLDQAIKYHSPAKAKSILIAFEETVSLLKTNPFFALRYSNIRCVPLAKKLPYMVHFTINESTKSVHIHALINTAKDPETYWVK
jgi:hypothetical protein